MYLKKLKNQLFRVYSEKLKRNGYYDLEFLLLFGCQQQADDFKYNLIYFLLKV